MSSSVSKEATESSPLTKYLTNDIPLAKDNLLEAGASSVSTSRWCNSCFKSIKDIRWEQCSKCGIFDLHDQIAGIQEACVLPEDAPHCDVDGGAHSFVSVTYYGYDPQLRAERWLSKFELIKNTAEPISDSYDLYLAAQGLQHRPANGVQIDMVALKVLDYLTQPTSSKILSLDGGGVRGYFTIMVLQALLNKLFPGNHTHKVSAKGFVAPDHPQWELIKHFDVIGGTSTGGFIAFALAVGYDLERLKQVYLDFGYYFRRPLISKITRVPIFTAKYDSTNIDNKIAEIVHDAWEYYDMYENGEERIPTLGSYRRFTYRQRKKQPFKFPSLIINAYNVTENDVLIFQTEAMQHSDYSMVDVLRATKAAPTYFLPVKIMCPSLGGAPPKECSFVDGGTFANDPALATVFAKSLQSDNQTYEIVSIGTTTFPTTVKLTPSGGLLSWLFPNPVEQFKNLFRGKNTTTDSSGLIIDTFMQANASLTEAFMSNLDPRKVRRFKFNFLLSEPSQLDDPYFTQLVDNNFKVVPGYVNIPESPDMQALVMFVKRHITEEYQDEIFRHVLKKDDKFTALLAARIAEKQKEARGPGGALQ